MSRHDSPIIAMETHHHGDMKAIHSAQGPTLCMRVESTKWTVSTGSFGRSLKMADRNPADINHREQIIFHSTTKNSRPWVAYLATTQPSKYNGCICECKQYLYFSFHVMSSIIGPHDHILASSGFKWLKSFSSHNLVCSVRTTDRFCRSQGWIIEQSNI